MRKLTIAMLLMTITAAGAAHAATWATGDPVVVNLGVHDAVTLSVSFKGADVSSTEYKQGDIGGFLTATTSDTVNKFGWKWETPDGGSPAEGIMTSDNGKKIHVKLTNADGTALPDMSDGYATGNTGPTTSMKVRYELTDTTAPAEDIYKGAVLTVVYV